MLFLLKLGLMTLTLSTAVQGQNENKGNGSPILDAAAIQKASASTGNDGKAADGQVDSKTSDENFINFCSGKTLTDGKQIEGGSCNGIVMGDIPSKNSMVATIITFPKTGGDPIKANQDFDITLKTKNLVTGSFTNAQTTYYSAPQQLEGGQIVGHTHVTVQAMSSLNPDQPLDTSQFAFFKGINDKANGDGTLTATVTGGLPVGFFRLCTLSSASNHQPVLLPVAQRGSSDDCTKFEVSNDGKASGQAGAASVEDESNSNSQKEDASNEKSEKKGKAKAGKKDDDDEDDEKDGKNKLRRRRFHRNFVL
ncbi:putative ribosomal protein s17 [Golovinomyces cichoracearum]|uniref:Putative ribosomal protein s17 n=1 Tax=Golovinomyces cichoracearum TaxID=62708 RepID=A0A420J1K4_9PEZI|nr:putative ribosomal protein s17 [Golovinomyces cichoracearum]